MDRLVAWSAMSKEWRERGSRTPEPPRNPTQILCCLREPCHRVRYNSAYQAGYLRPCRVVSLIQPRVAIRCPKELPSGWGDPTPPNQLTCSQFRHVWLLFGGNVSETAIAHCPSQQIEFGVSQRTRGDFMKRHPLTHKSAFGWIVGAGVTETHPARKPLVEQSST